MNDLERRFRAAVPRFSREGWSSAEARELRRQAVAHVRRRYQAGERVAVIAPRLGLAEATLYRWLREVLDDDERAPRLRRVEVAAPSATGTSHGAAASGLALVTPSGHRVEGLALADVRALLADLR
jgi:hypothetical protein